MSSSADSAARPLPRLNRVWEGQVEPLNMERLAAETDLTFLAVPENAAAELAPPLVDAGVRVIDLSGAFRIKDSVSASRWYPATKELPAGSAYGLTEFFKDEVRDARLVANPGCYPTAALLSLLPLSQAGLLDADADVVIDAKSGISGAGRAPSDRTHFSENHGSVAAYGVLNHRHVAEMEQALGAMVTFVPAPGAARPRHPGNDLRAHKARHTAEQIGDAFQAAYARRAVHPADGRRAAGNQARRVHEFLRHRLAVRRRPRAASSSCRASTTS